MSLTDTLNRLYEEMSSAPRDRAKAQGDELVVAHPVERHGVFVRDGGWLDLASGTQVLGLGPDGLVADLNVLDVRAAVSSISTSGLWIETARDGLVINGYVPDYGILRGELIARYLRDAQVVVTRGSLRRLQDARGKLAREAVESPVCAECPSLVSVPLSSLIEPFPWSRPVSRRLLDKFRDVLNRVRGGAS